LFPEFDLFFVSTFERKRFHVSYILPIDAQTERLILWFGRINHFNNRRNENIATECIGGNLVFSTLLFANFFPLVFAAEQDFFEEEDVVLFVTVRSAHIETIRENQISSSINIKTL
jgi:hypothetical protein